MDDLTCFFTLLSSQASLCLIYPCKLPIESSSHMLLPDHPCLAIPPITDKHTRAVAKERECSGHIHQKESYCYSTYLSIFFWLTRSEQQAHLHPLSTTVLIQKPRGSSAAAGGGEGPSSAAAASSTTKGHRSIIKMSEWIEKDDLSAGLAEGGGASASSSSGQHHSMKHPKDRRPETTVGRCSQGWWWCMYVYLITLFIITACLRFFFFFVSVYRERGMDLPRGILYVNQEIQKG